MSLIALRSEILNTPHGFFTRAGGASSGIFKGLNCGVGSTDQRDVVALNRGRVAQSLDIVPAHLLGVHQVHSADVVTVHDAKAARPKADAMVTATPGLGLSVLTADCQPVLLHDAQAGVIGAAHAGWKGALDGILAATIAAMEALGAKRGQIHAAIGPCISQAAYEVGPEFIEQFLDADPEYSRFFANGKGDRYLFDLPGFGLHQLRAAGVGRAEWLGHCTFADAEQFYSYRRTTHAKEAPYGRLFSVIRL